MIAAWMLQTVAVTFLLYAAAMGADHVGRALRLPTRFAWLLAITAAVVLSARALLPRGDVSRPVAATVRGPTSFSSAAETPIAGRGTTLPSAAIETPVTRFITVERSLGGAVSRIDVSALDRWNPLLIVAWAVASGLVLSWLLVSFVRLRRLASRLVPATVAGHAVLVSDGVGPALLGVLRTRIVLPRWVLGLPPAEQEIIVAHERQHARAFDPALVCASMCIVALQPWNVVLRMLLERLRLAVEADCDRRVLDRAGDARAYGKLLVAMYERTSVGSPHVAFVERGSNLERRIRRITSRPRLFSAAVGASAIAAMVFATAAWKTSAPTRTTPLMSPGVGASAIVTRVLMTAPRRTPEPLRSTAPSPAEMLTKPFAAESGHEEPQVTVPSESRPAESPTVTFRQIVIDANDVTRTARLADSVADLLRRGAPFDSLAKQFHDSSINELTNVLTPWPVDSLPPYYQKGFAGAHAGDVVAFQIPGLRRPRFVVAQLLTVQPREEQQAPAPRRDPISGLAEAVHSTAVLAQTSSIRVTIESPNHAQYRLEVPEDSTMRPMLLRGRTVINWGAPARRSDASFLTMEITSLDTTSQVHVEAAQNGRVVASGEGSYLMLRRDSVGVAIEAWSHTPPSTSPGLGKPSRTANYAVNPITGQLDSMSIDAETAAVVLRAERRGGGPTGPCAMPDSIAIRGLSRLRDADVRSALGVTPRTMVTGPVVTAALKNLYATNNFEPNPTTTCEIVGGKSVLVFNVRERPSTRSSNVLHFPLDSTSARLVELELKRVSSATDSASVRRLDAQIAMLHDRLRSSPGGVAADREATTRVVLALEMRASAVRSRLGDLRAVYTDEYPAVRNARAEDRAIGERLGELVARP